MANEVSTPAQLYIQAANLPTNWLPSGNITEAVAAAMARYDQDSPRVKYDEISGDGGQDYDLSAVAGSWDEDSSQVLGVDYPWSLGTDNELDWDDWEVWEDPTNGATLYFQNHTPAATESFRLQYTIAWTEGTVPSKHLRAVAKLAASEMARMIAARRAQTSESTINADIVTGQSETQQWLTLAKALLADYETEVLGASEEGEESKVGPGFGVFDLDPGSVHGYGKVTDWADE
jgi:hypothetical protein